MCMQLPALEENRVKNNLVLVLFMELYIRDMPYPFVDVIGSYLLSKRHERGMWMISCREHSSKRILYQHLTDRHSFIYLHRYFYFFPSLRHSSNVNLFIPFY